MIHSENDLNASVGVFSERIIHTSKHQSKLLGK